MLGRRSLATALLALACGLLAPSAASADGELRQLAGLAGCVSDTGNAGACADGTAVAAPRDVAVSPDGRHVYVAAQTSAAVVAFARDAEGRLTQVGCVSATGSGGACADGRALGNPRAVVVSPDGASVYVGGGVGVAIFDRQPDGSLVQKSGTDGCRTQSGNDGADVGVCGTTPMNATVDDLAIAPDGNSVYAAAFDLNGVAVYDRAPGGALAPKAGAAACQSTGGGVCTTSRGTATASAVVVSADGEHVYVAGGSDDAIAVFDRAAGGALTQKAGPAGCVDELGADGCADGLGLDLPVGLAVTADGASLYATTANSNALLVFDVLASGAIAQKAGTNGCLSLTGLGGLCTVAPTLNTAASVVVGPGGKEVYVGSTSGGGAATTFDRSPSGTLVQRPGAEGCTTQTALAPCATGRGLSGTRSIAIAPDGRSVYAASSDAANGGVAAFERVVTPTCAAAAAAGVEGGDVPLTIGCTAPDGGPVALDVVTAPGTGSLVSVDSPRGTVVYRPAEGQGPGTVSFLVRGRVRTAFGDARPATVTLTARPPGAAPTPQTPAPVVREVVRPVVVLVADRTTARRGARVTLRYVATTGGRLTLQICRGTKVLQTTRATGRAGRRSFRVRLSRGKLPRGRYTLRLTLRTSDGRTDTDTARLTVR